MHDPQLSIVMVNWNGLEALQRGLPSLEASIEHLGLPAEVVVVDNGSTDGSLEYLDEHHPNVTVLRNETNEGVSPAVNRAVRASTGRYVVTVNNDVVSTPDWLAELVRVADEDEAIGSVAAQMRYLDHPDRINSAGICIDLLGRAWDRHDGHLVADESHAPHEVFGACTGAAMFRRQMFDEIGLFDESFFAYMDDVDLAWRARRHGWRCVYVPTAVVLHEFSATSRRIPGLKQRLSVRNTLWTLVMNASPLQLAVAVPGHVLLAGWITMLSIVRRETDGLRGLVQGVAGLRPRFRARRRPYLPLGAFERPTALRFRAADRNRAEGASSGDRR